jgi:hypothetical protein
MTGMFSGLGNSYDEWSKVHRGRLQAMSEYSTTDWYRIAQEQPTGVALAVQRQDELDLEALSAMATGIAEALK